ncbi:MAG: hypothetical protein H6878_02825 [Rhodobiaceae bacterium]|nr:hypothetical protein [Rhodobiaceae bacterium]
MAGVDGRSYSVLRGGPALAFTSISASSSSIASSEISNTDDASFNRLRQAMVKVERIESGGREDRALAPNLTADPRVRRHTVVPLLMETSQLAESLATGTTGSPVTHGFAIPPGLRVQPSEQQPDRVLREAPSGFGKTGPAGGGDDKALEMRGPPADTPDQELQEPAYRETIRRQQRSTSTLAILAWFALPAVVAGVLVFAKPSLIPGAEADRAETVIVRGTGSQDAAMLKVAAAPNESRADNAAKALPASQSAGETPSGAVPAAMAMASPPAESAPATTAETLQTEIGSGGVVAAEPQVAEPASPPPQANEPATVDPAPFPGTVATSGQFPVEAPAGAAPQPPVTDARSAALQPQAPEPAPSGLSTSPARKSGRLDAAVAATGRDPARVAAAVDAVPALSGLAPEVRSNLQSRLENGECLSSALPAVLGQVPVLAMRDMIRLLEGDCL